MRYLALLLIGWISLPVEALTKVDIYRTEVVINSERENGELMAREQGMKEIIVRATGSQASLSNPVIEKALSLNSRYISQLSYGQVEGQSSLKMRFNSGQIHSLLTQAQLPTWSPYRSNILVWVIEEKAYDRTIAWEHSDSSNIAALRTAAYARGLPVTFPVGDFEDVTGVNVSDFWGGFVEPIATASQRYPAEAVLVLRTQGNQVRWTLYDQSPSAILVSQPAPRSGSFSGSNAIAATIDSITDYYASKSAVVVAGESSDGMTMKVVNVNSAADFFHLEKVLKKLSSVASSELKRVQGNELTLKLHLLAPKEVFVKEASSIKQLTEYQHPELPLGPNVMAVEVPANDVQESEPVVIQPLQEQYDAIYEWNSGKRS